MPPNFWIGLKKLGCKTGKERNLQKSNVQGSHTERVSVISALSMRICKHFEQVEERTDTNVRLSVHYAAS